MKVDIVRGARDYIRAVDLIIGSPLPRDADQFRFVFRHVVHAPGRWVPGRHDTDPAATLSIRQQSNSFDWSFVVDEGGAVRSLPDIDEDGLLGDPVINGSEMTCTLSGHATLWDQLVAATRTGGKQLFPDANWYLISLQGNAVALRDGYGGAQLSLSLGRRKGHVLELGYGIDGQPAGRIGLYAR